MRRRQGGRRSWIDCFWEALSLIRSEIEKPGPLVGMLSGKLLQARERLEGRKRAPRSNAPDVTAVNSVARSRGKTMPGRAQRCRRDGITTLRARAGPCAGLLQQGKRRRAALRLRRTSWARRAANIDRRRVPAGVFQREREPRGPPPFPGRDLRGCDDRHPGRDLQLRAQHRGRAPRTAPSLPRSGTSRPACTPLAARRGAPSPASRTAPHRRVRARRPEDRGGRPHPCGPAAAPAPAGQLPAGDDHHPDAVGPPGDLVAPVRGAGRRPAVIAPFVTRPE